MDLGYIALRAAMPGDAKLLRDWDRHPHVIAGHGGGDWEWETELSKKPEWREQLIAQAHGKPIGFVQIMDPAREDSHYWGDVDGGLRAVDIWIGEPEYLNRGFGTRIMRLALARCFAAPEVTAVIIDPLASNTRAHRFYERLGFRWVERRAMHGHENCIYRLERADFTG